MKTYLGCIPCFVRQALEAVQMVTDDPAVQERALRQVLRQVADFDMTKPPPAMGQAIHRIIRDITGVKDPYYEAKRRFNRFAHDLAAELSRTIDAADDPVAAALHIAAAGNIVDLGAKSGLDHAEIHDAIRNALNDPLDPADVEAFKQAVAAADDALYIGDNAGEIVFDRLLIEHLQNAGIAHDNVTFVVRGRPIINDAVFEDAVEAGVTDRVPVIDNGSDAPGTILADCSPAFRDRFRRADLIIAKGQGNYETLSGVDRPIFFLLKIKCPVIAEDIGCPIGALVLRKK